MGPERFLLHAIRNQASNGMLDEEEKTLLAK